MSGCAQGVCRDGAVIAAGNRSASAGFKPDWQRPRGFRYGATVRLCPVVPRTGDRRGQHLRGVLDLCGLPTSGAGAGDAVPDEHQPRAHPTALPVSWTITPGRVSSPKKSIAASSRRAAKGASGPRAPTKRSKSALAHKRSLLTPAGMCDVVCYRQDCASDLNIECNHPPSACGHPNSGLPGEGRGPNHDGGIRSSSCRNSGEGESSSCSRTARSRNSRVGRTRNSRAGRTHYRKPAQRCRRRPLLPATPLRPEGSRPAHGWGVTSRRSSTRSR